MKRRIMMIACLCAMLITVTACSGSKPTSSPVTIPSVTPEPTLTSTSTPTLAPTPELALTPAPTQTSTPTPASIPTPVPVPTPVNQRPELDVQDFVRGTFFNGLPYEEANKYDSSDVPVLLTMLQNLEEMAYWPTIVGTLGAIGDEQAVDSLISFLEEDVSGILSREHYVAKTTVLMSLGYLINKSGSQKALMYLKDSLYPPIWDQRELMWESPYASSTTQRNEQLISMAVIGLALSGHPEAREALLLFQQGIGSGPEFKNVVLEALGAHVIIAREGLTAYYKNSRIN